MKKIWLVLTAILFASYSYAETEAVGEKNLLAALAATKTLAADFTQTNTYKDATSPKPVVDDYSGKVYVIMGNKALFEYTLPYESWYIFTKESVESYDSITNQLMKFGKDSGSSNIFLQVLMDFATIGDNFDVMEKAGNVLYMTPKNENMGIKYFTITLDANKKISTMQTEDIMGTVTELKFKNVKLGGRIPEKTFKKELPKTVTIIEG